MNANLRGKATARRIGGQYSNALKTVTCNAALHPIKGERGPWYSDLTNGCCKPRRHLESTELLGRAHYNDVLQ